MRKNILLCGLLAATISVSVSQKAAALDFSWLESPEAKELRLKQQAEAVLATIKLERENVIKETQRLARFVTVKDVDCIVLAYRNGTSIKALSCNWEKYNTDQLIKQSEENINKAKERVIKWLEKPSK